MEWNNDKTIDFINDYQRKPLLWRATHADYKNRAKRKDAINELSVSYGLDYQGVLSKIKSLRSYFHREQINLKKRIKSGMSADCLPTSSWFAYKHLQFIAGEEVAETVKDTMGMNDLAVTETEEEINDDINGGPSNEYSCEENLLGEPEHIKATIKPPPTKRQKQMEKKKKEEAMVADAYSYLKSVKESQSDEVSIFGELVAHKIRTLPLPVRPLAQHAVLTTLLEFEIANNRQRPVSTLSTPSPSDSTYEAEETLDDDIFVLFD